MYESWLADRKDQELLDHVAAARAEFRRLTSLAREERSPLAASTFIQLQHRTSRGRIGTRPSSPVAARKEPARWLVCSGR
jgi:hypothetical protein